LLIPSLPPAALSEARIAAAYAIFLASYIVFAIGKFPWLKIDRTGAAIIGAVGMVAFRIVPPREAVHFIDFGTIVLLFSMMLIVGNLHLVGFFEWTAEVVLRRMRPVHLPGPTGTFGNLGFSHQLVHLIGGQDDTNKNTTQQVDPTMAEAVLILEEFRGKLRQLHVSQVNSQSKHDPVSWECAMAFSTVASLIPPYIPIILESRLPHVGPQQIAEEMKFVAEILDAHAVLQLAGD
jgi:hypothetical protein